MDSIDINTHITSFFEAVFKSEALIVIFMGLVVFLVWKVIEAWRYRNVDIGQLENNLPAPPPRPEPQEPEHSLGFVRSRELEALRGSQEHINSGLEDDIKGIKANITLLFEKIDDIIKRELARADSKKGD